MSLSFDMMLLRGEDFVVTDAIINVMKRRKAMLKSEVQDVLETFFETDDWNYHKLYNEETDRMLYHYGVKTEGVIDSIGAQFAVMDDEVVSMAFYPVRIEEERYGDIMDFIGRINSSCLSFVHLVLDYDHKMVMASWHHDITCEQSFDEDLAERMVWEPVLTLADCSDDLLLIAKYGVSGKEQFETAVDRWERTTECDEGDGEGNFAQEQKLKPMKFFIRL